MLAGLQTIWRRMPPALRQNLRPFANSLILRLSGIRAHAGARATGPVVVTGFHREVLGLGRAARLTADALERAGIEVIRHDARAVLDAGSMHTSDLPDGGAWILQCNPPEASVILARLRPRSWRDRYRIGYWAWELEAAPRDWILFSRNFNEIWAPSPFVAAALDGSAVPVIVAPHPAPPSHVQPPAAADGVVTFLAFADMRSSAARKNPNGAVEAFLRAYPEAQGAARLVVKIVRPEVDDRAFVRLQGIAARRPDIAILSEELSDEGVMALIGGCDVLLSLHRSEGFGLTLLEAMAQGRAVLATGWSGNMAFMEGFADALLPYALVPVQDPSGQYPASARWAEPDLDAAAGAIRRLAADGALRRACGAEGRRRAAAVAAWWSAENLGVRGLRCAAPPMRAP